MPVIGFLDARSPDDDADRLRAFRQGLKEWAMSRARTWRSNTAGPRIKIDRLPELAAELVRRQVAVIVASGGTRRRGGQGGNHDDPDRLRRRR